MILPLSMGEIARVCAAIRARRAIPDPSSDTAAGFPNSLPRRGAAGDGPEPCVTGGNLIHESARDGQSHGFRSKVERIPVHNGGDTL